MVICMNDQPLEQHHKIEKTNIGLTTTWWVALNEISNSFQQTQQNGPNFEVRNSMVEDPCTAKIYKQLVA
jgi:hypothetical protein